MDAQNTLQSIIVFIVLLGGLVFVHELGHFLLAKRAGVRVEEFGIGFPPRLFAFRRGETEYSLNAIPLGGFVRMLGEEDPTAPRSFAAAARWWRVAILAAGATMNFVAATLLFSGAYATGWPTVTQSEVIITDVVVDTPASQSGLRPGDIVRSYAGQPVADSSQLRQLIRASVDKPSKMVVSRAGADVSVEVTPRATAQTDQGQIGVRIDDHPLRVEQIAYGFPAALTLGAGRTVQTILLTFEIPVLAIQHLIPAEVARPMGPVGIFQAVSQATTETTSTGWWFPVLSLAAAISAGLGIANLLPIPGLDGGRLLFVLIEAVRGRRISPRRESMIHFIGLAFLVSMIVVVTYFDVLSPVNLDLPPR
jgi:regulator of sigma E protease